MRGHIAGGAIALALMATTVASATQPLAPFDQATWTKGSIGFNQKLNCLSLLNCFSYTVMWNTVSVRGPEGNFAARPKVGERFYVRTEMAILNNPFDPIDSYKTRVLLPDGVAPAVTASDDVICAITNTSNVSVRLPGPSECQDPVQMGVMWEFPAVSLNEDNVSQVWFPVVATKPVDGAVIQMTGQAMTNPLTLLPNPVLSQLALYVDPATPTAPAAPPSTPVSRGTGSATTPLTGVVAAPGTGGLGISWPAATAPGVTGYRVQARIVKTTRWITVGTTTRAVTKIRWKKAKRGKRYQVRVAAIIGGVVGAWSKPVTVTAR